MRHEALRLSPEVIAAAEAAAIEEGMPVERLVEAILADALGRRRDETVIRERAARARPDAALAILNRASALPAEPWDEMPEDR